MKGTSLPGFIEWNYSRDSAVVPEWLNAALGTESYMRVMALIEEIRTLEKGLNNAWRSGWYHSTRSKPQAPAVLKELQALDKKHEAIRQSLEQYSFHPSMVRILGNQAWMLLMESRPAQPEYVFHRVVHEENKRNTDGSLTTYQHIEQSISESDVVLRILNLAAASELERVQQCKRCQKWFHAQRSHQKFCSDECRLTDYSNSPKFKNYRKQYMRRHRAEEKARVAKLDRKGS